jgi:hypothetical protein
MTAATGKHRAGLVIFILVFEQNVILLHLLRTRFRNRLRQPLGCYVDTEMESS